MYNESNLHKIICAFVFFNSSVSSAMNGMAAVAWEDIFKERLGNRINKDNLSIFLKVLGRYHNVG